MYDYHLTPEIPGSIADYVGVLIITYKESIWFEQTYMYEILVTGPLCTSECAGDCRFSANLCKRSLLLSLSLSFFISFFLSYLPPSM